MNTWLAAQSVARPDGIALIADGEVIAYRELYARVVALADQLAGWGVERGMQLALLLPNSLTAAIAIHAGIQAGVTLVLLNTRLTTHELEAQLAQTACVHLIYSQETAAVAEALASRSKDKETRRQGDKAVEYSTLRMVRLAASVYGRTNIQTATSLQRSNAPTLDLNAPFAIIFTSGTSGTPKGAVLSYGAIFASAMASAYRIGTLPDDRWLCVLPLFHVGGVSILLRACLYGIAVDLWRQFDATKIAQHLLEQPITLISLVPTMLQRLLDVPGVHVPRTLRLVLLGGAAATAELMTRALDLGWPISTTYGLTEAASQVATALPDAVRLKPLSVGKPLIFTTIRIVDEFGDDQPPGVYGEILISGPTVMSEYLGAANRDQETRLRRELSRTGPGDQETAQNSPILEAPIIANSDQQSATFATGDIGYLDADGDLFVVQRRSDLIISGGENIYPAEVESVLRGHPAILDVAVIGVDSPEWGQRVAAVIVVRAPAPSTTEIEAYCRERLAGYKVPRVVVFVAELPRTAAGKIQRPALLAMIAASVTP